MSSDLAKTARCFGLYDDDKIIGFCGVLHQPHAKTKNIKRCTRLVILPDYQGIGLGTKFLQSIAEYYHSQGFEFSIVTSAKNMIFALKNNYKWRCIRYSATRNNKTEGTIDCNRSTMRTQCKTASFFYRGE